MYLVIFSVTATYIWTFLQMLLKVTFGRHANPSIAGVIYVSSHNNYFSWWVSCCVVILQAENLLWNPNFVILSYDMLAKSSRQYNPFKNRKLGAG